MKVLIKYLRFQNLELKMHYVAIDIMQCLPRELNPNPSLKFALLQWKVGESTLGGGHFK
jgi:hypothetical protein